MGSRLGTRIEFRKRLTAELASRFRPLSIQSVVAPVTAGGLLLQDLASELNAEFAFYDVDDHSRPVALRRGYAVHGRTAVINDMTTTGEGIRQMLRILSENGAQPVAVGLVATRGTLGAQIVKELSDDGLQVEALLHLNIEAVPQESCAKCRLGLPTASSADINR